MKMNKELFAFFISFLVLIGVSIYLGNADQITPNVAQAQADLAIGATPVLFLEKGLALIVKIFAGALFAGIGTFAYTEIRKAYKLWQRNSMTKRWSPGPNANWRVQQPKQPALSRMDLLTLMLAGKLPDMPRKNQRIISTPNASDPSDEEVKLMEF